MSANQKYTIAVCDDERLDCEEITRLADMFYKEQGISCDIHTYESCTALLQAVQNGIKYHLLLLDIMMEELDGMELAALLRGQGNETAIVFISNNREFAMRGYEVDAVRYLGKPLDPDKLNEALDYCWRHFNANTEILLPTAKGLQRISPSNIMYVEAGTRVVKIFLENEQIDAALRLFELESLLSPRQFVLCHRAFLVNLAYARYIRCYEIELNNGSIVPVSKHRFGDTKQILIDYLNF